MALPLTSELFHFLDASGQSLQVPLEWMPALVQLSISEEQWTTARLWLQDAELSVYAKPSLSGLRILADWPRNGPGHYRLRLDRPDQPLHEETIRIEPRKITGDSFARLIDDLQSRLPSAVAVALQRAGALAGVQLIPPHESTLADQIYRLSWAIEGKGARPGLAAVLDELAVEHHQLLSAFELWMPIEKARRPSLHRLAAAFAKPGNLGHDQLPNRVAEIRTEHTADVYENRLVKVFHDELRSRLTYLSRLLVTSQQSQHLASECRALLTKLTRSRRKAAFLDEVGSPTYLPTNVTMVLAKRPPYLAVLEGYIEYHKNLSVRLEHPALDAPLENLPCLYQLWGTMQLLRLLAEVGVNLGYQVKKEQLFKRDPSGIFVTLLPDGQPILVLHHPTDQTTVRLIPERTYGRSGPFQSISYEQRPDIALEVERSDGTARIYLFDPKYKLLSEDLPPQVQEDLPSREEVIPIDNPLASSARMPNLARPQKADIDKMHAYRDAIRDSYGNRAVAYAAILYPGPFKGFRHHDIAALPAIPGSEDLLEEHLYPLLLSALQPSNA
jgi:hypothetical protein